MSKPIRQRGAWRIRWIDENGRRQSEVHQRHEDARFALSRHEAHVEERRRGLRDLEIPKKKFDELFDYWITYRASQKRNQKDDESVIRAHLRPYFGGKLLSEIRGADIDAFKISKKHLSNKTVSNILTLLITMLNLAVDEGWIRKYPKIKKPKVSIFSKDFNYLKTNDEVQRFLLSTQTESQMIFTIYAIAVYTGMREGEIAGLEWGDIDFDNRRITVQRSFDGLTKNELIRRIPILDVLMPILKGWRLTSPTKIVFPNRDGRIFRESARIFQESLHKVLDRAGFPKIQKNGKERRYVVFHDLRHTFASHWMMNGGDLFKLSKILGHQTIEMTQRYAHLAPHVFDADLNRLNNLMPVQNGKVLSLHPSSSLAK